MKYFIYQEIAYIGCICSLLLWKFYPMTRLISLNHLWLVGFKDIIHGGGGVGGGFYIYINLEIDCHINLEIDCQYTVTFLLHVI